MDNIVLYTNDKLYNRINLAVTAIITQYIPPAETLNYDTLPRMSVEENKHLGQVDLTKQTVMTEFFIRNDGGGNLYIYKVEMGDGCQLISLDASVVPPSKTTKMIIKLYDIGRTGTQDHYVTLFTNDPYDTSKKLTITTKIGDDRPKKATQTKKRRR
jgi:hypothetical protein